MNNNNSFINIWKERLSNKGLRNEFLIVLSILVTSLIAISNFLLFNELRHGSVLSDPILNLFSPIDVTWITFVVIYSGLIAAIIYLANKPELLTLAFLTYSFTALARIAAMYSLPLDPPTGIIPLNDPFVQLFGSGNILLKDLFFSGHTSTLFLLFLIITDKRVKSVFLLLTITVAVCVLLQHVHYTVDVIAAPFFTYAAYKFSENVIIFLRKVV